MPVKGIIIIQNVSGFHCFLVYFSRSYVSFIELYPASFPWSFLQIHLFQEWTQTEGMENIGARRRVDFCLFVCFKHEQGHDQGGSALDMKSS